MAEANPAVALLADTDSLARDPKATEDYTEAVNEKIKQIQAVSSAEELDVLLTDIFALEKKARQASDGSSVSKLCLALIDQMAALQLWPLINVQITALCKRRGQLKRVISDLIKQGMNLVDRIDDKGAKKALVDTLASISEEKIFVEVERARLVHKQAEMLEEENQVVAAAELLQEVPVETIGGMSRRERSLYILDQMRLVLQKKDFVRCQIISKNMNAKVLDTSPDLADVKLRYYRYMIQYHLNEKDYLSIAKAAKASYNTPILHGAGQPLSDDSSVNMESVYQCYAPELQSRIENSRDAPHKALADLLMWTRVMYLALVPYSAEPLDLLRDLRETESKALERVPALNQLVGDLLSNELVTWPLSYEAQLKAAEPFKWHCTMGEPAGQQDAWVAFHQRLIEHNVMTLSKYYTRIPMAKAAFLCGLSPVDCEATIAKLVNRKNLHAKVDRPAGIVVFAKPRSSRDVVDAWTTNISKMLDSLHLNAGHIKNARLMDYCT